MKFNPINGIGITTHEFDIQKGEFPFADVDETFDAVTCFHVMKYFHHTLRYGFDGIYRILNSRRVIKFNKRFYFK